MLVGHIWVGLGEAAPTWWLPTPTQRILSTLNGGVILATLNVNRKQILSHFFAQIFLLSALLFLESMYINLIYVVFLQQFVLWRVQQLGSRVKYNRSSTLHQKTKRCRSKTFHQPWQYSGFQMASSSVALFENIQEIIFYLFR